MNHQPTQQNFQMHHDDDNDSAHGYLPDRIDSPLRRSTQALITKWFFSGQITYGLGPLPKANSQNNNGPSGCDQNSANYVSTHSAKSDKHIVFDFLFFKIIPLNTIFKQF